MQRRPSRCVTFPETGLRARCCSTTTSKPLFKLSKPMRMAHVFPLHTDLTSQGLEEKVRTLEDELRKSRQDGQDLRAQLNDRAYRPSAGPESSPLLSSQASQGRDQHCLTGDHALSCLPCSMCAATRSCSVSARFNSVTNYSRPTSKTISNAGPETGILQGASMPWRLNQKSSCA